MVRSYQIQGLESKIFGLKYGVHHRLEDWISKFGGELRKNDILRSLPESELELVTQELTTNTSIAKIVEIALQAFPLTRGQNGYQLKSSAVLMIFCAVAPTIWPLLEESYKDEVVLIPESEQV